MTGNELIKLLMSSDVAIGEALVILKNRQTYDEQRDETTRHENDRGFRPCHARMGTSMAQFFERNGYLSAKQANWWRVRGKEGSRIAIYHRQLLQDGIFKRVRSEVHQ